MRPFSRREARSHGASAALPIAAVLGFVAAATLAVAVALPHTTASAGEPAMPLSVVPAGVAGASSALAVASGTPAPTSSGTPSPTPSPSPTSTPHPATVQPRALTAPSPPRPLNLATRATTGIAFTRPVSCGQSACQVLLDVYAPTTPGDYPAVVLVRGGPSGMGGRIGLAPFAKQLAARGHVVFNADMRDVAASGGGYPEAFEDVACAVRFARAQAARYGGDPSRVVLVGHSLGGWVGSVVAFGEERDDDGCLYGGSGRPDAFVGLAGNYDLTSPLQIGDLLTFFGGDALSTGAARAKSDPLALTPVRIPVRLIAGTQDGSVDPAASALFEKRLEQFGLDSALTRVPGGTHVSIISIAADGATSLAVIDQVAGGLPDEPRSPPRGAFGSILRSE